MFNENSKEAYDRDSLILDQPTNEEKINGISYDDIARPAYLRLKRLLSDYGNKPDEGQKKALKGLCKAFTDIARNHLKGRYAFPLPTGAGKTLSIICWVSQLYKSGVTDKSVAICTSKVEELCQIKRQLVGEGIPSDAIGLIHSYIYDEDRDRDEELPPGYASLPSTKENQDKQILLVTHNRVRGNGNIDQYNSFRGKPRDLFIWDESLFIAESHAISIRKLEQAIGWFEPLLKDNPFRGCSLDYLKGSMSIINREVERQKKGEDPSIIMFHELLEGLLPIYKEMLGNSKQVDGLKRFYDLSDREFRVIAEQGGLITYDKVIPDELENIIVLDASYNIRWLSQASVKHIDNDRAYPVYDTDAFKVSYRNVTVKQLQYGSGRETVTNIQKERKREDRLISLELAEVVRRIPEEQGVIIFTFKTRLSDKADLTGILKKDFQGLGIDTTATINIDGQQKPRFVWLTWGQETAISHYSYCSNVIFAGVLHRSLLDLAGTVIGENDDFTRNLSAKNLNAYKKSEIGHVIYQGGARSCLRIIIDGVAKETNIWLIHNSKICDLLNNVMPGAQWEVWEPKYLKKVRNVTKTEELTEDIISFLHCFRGDLISVQKLKKQMGTSNASKRTFTRALEKALETGIHWKKDKQSLVRKTNQDYNFQTY